MKQGMDEGLIYEILSVVEEIPEGKVATYGQIARLIGREKKCKAGRKSAWHGIVLWKLSMSSSSKPCGASGTRLAGAAVSAGR